MDLAFLDAAIKQKNIGLSRKYVRKLKDLSQHKNPEKNYRWRFARCQQIFLQGFLEKDMKKKVDDCFRSWKLLGKISIITCYLTSFNDEFFILQKLSKNPKT